jgi:hypothetical protein
VLAIFVFAVACGASSSPPSETLVGPVAQQHLTSEQIRVVVTARSPQLQECWELAIRGMREVPITRFEIEVTIGASGGVADVVTSGPSIGRLTACLERRIGTWAFPPSRESSRVRFPVIFRAL